MYSKIIAGYDGRPSSEDALALAKTIAESTGAELTAAGIMLADPYWGGPDPKLSGSRPTSAMTSPRRRTRSEPTSRYGLARPRARPSRARRADSRRPRRRRLGQRGQGRTGVRRNVALSLLHGSPRSVAVAPKGYAEQPNRPSRRSPSVRRLARVARRSKTHSSSRGAPARRSRSWPSSSRRRSATARVPTRGGPS